MAQGPTFQRVFQIARVEEIIVHAEEQSSPGADADRAGLVTEKKIVGGPVPDLSDEGGRVAAGHRAAVVAGGVGLTRRTMATVTSPLHPSGRLQPDVLVGAQGDAGVVPVDVAGHDDEAFPQAGRP